MLAKAQLTIMPLYPNIIHLIQVLIFISKIKVKTIEDNLADINADNESSINDIFLFFSILIIKANTIPSNIKKYNIGGIGIFVRV